MTIDEQKASLRKQALALRSRLDPALGTLVAASIFRNLRPAPGSTVAGVWPLPGEMDLRPLLHALEAAGHRIVLPETTPLGQPLKFRVWRPGCAMVRERFGTYRSTGAYAAPDIVLVPLLAFDRSGARLGYGGGYYDRTLAELPDALAVGFGYAAQEVARVPNSAQDQKLRFVVTEQEVIRAVP